MKIVHVITGLRRGGAEFMLLRLVRELNEATVVVSLMDDGDLGSELRALGIPVRTLGMRPGRFSPRDILRLRRILLQEQPDILQTWLYHADFVGLLASAYLSDMRLVWNIQCSDMDLSQYSLVTRAVRFASRCLSRMPSAVVVNSEAGRRIHESLGYRPRRWEFIPNGFDISLFRPNSTARSRVRAELGICGDEIPLIGMAARLDPMKDHANFLAAAVQLAASHRDVRFVVVGRGTETLTVPASLRGRLNILGEREDMPGLLPALDLLVVASAFGEGFPNVIGEAMACAVPCVATDVGDARQMIGETGLVVPPRDPSALSGAMREMLGRGVAARMAARERIVEHYAIRIIAAHYRRLYESLLRFP